MRKKPFFPQYDLGLRRNPFAALTNEEWGEIAFLPEALPNVNLTHLQLLGREGSGKSSLLHYFYDQSHVGEARVVYEYIPEGQTRFFSRLIDVDIFLLDEAQRLNGWWRHQWLMWLRGDDSRRVIFSSHTPLDRWFRWYRLSLQTYDVETAVSPAYYRQWIERRLTYFALPDTAQPLFSDEATCFLFEQFGADMREAEYFLYELFQKLETAVEITVPILKSVLTD